MAETGLVEGGQLARVGLLLRPRDCGFSRALARQTEQWPRQRRYLDHATLETHYGAATEDLAAVAAFSAQHRLEVLEINREGRLVLLRGSLDQLGTAFSCSFEAATVGQRRYHRPRTVARLPTELRDAVEGVYGLDNQPRLGRLPRRHHALIHATPDAPATTEAASPRRLCRPQAAADRYRFPPGATGKGQTIALVLLGGGFYQEDLHAFFGDRSPQIEVVAVGDGANDPAPRRAIRAYLRDLRAGRMPSGDPHLFAQIAWTLEATADVQLAGSFAPDARLVVYFGSNHELGELETLTAALTDRQRDAQIVACSWGTYEAEVDPSYARALDRVFQLADLRGVSLCFASGDRGADLHDGQPNAHFPASSPHVLSCGGTTLSKECLASRRRPETVWNESRGSYLVASGGGFSRLFRRPGWQPAPPGDAVPAGRGLPDVAAKADLGYGYRLVLAGEPVSGGGTSSAVPLWAGLLARLNEALGTRVGWLPPLLEALAASAVLEDIRIGDNSYYQAAIGWDPCTGWGTPNGKALLAALGRT